MRRCTWIVLVLVLSAIGAGAQGLDVSVGAGTAAGGNVSGGFWPSVSVTGMVTQHAGVNVEFATRAQRKSPEFYQNSFRPWVFDANLTLRPAQMRWTPELLLGWAEFHTQEDDIGCLPALINGVPVPCLAPGKTFGGFHLGVAVKNYIAGPVFLRYSYDLYTRVQRKHVQRFTLMLGYTFGSL